MFLTAMLTLAFQQPVGSDQSSNSQDGDGVPADAGDSEVFHQGRRRDDPNEAAEGVLR